jgi:uncharacterized protein (TIGR00255 family)
MPVYSMTGYASGQNGSAGSHSEAENRPPAGGRLGVEIRSVNSRFLDLTFKLPEELRQHETALRELLTGKLKRGKVEVRAAIENTAQAGVVEPSVKLLQRLNGVQDNIKAWLPGPGSSAWPTCCAWPAATARPGATGAPTCSR